MVKGAYALIILRYVHAPSGVDPGIRKSDSLPFEHSEQLLASGAKAMQKSLILQPRPLNHSRMQFLSSKQKSVRIAKHNT